MILEKTLKELIENLKLKLQEAMNNVQSLLQEFCAPPKEYLGTKKNLGVFLSDMVIFKRREIGVVLAMIDRRSEFRPPPLSILSNVVLTVPAMCGGVK